LPNERDGRRLGFTAEPLCQRGAHLGIKTRHVVSPQAEPHSQQPETHAPLPSNAMVLPLSGR
jgi:hypothetical protein